MAELTENAKDYIECLKDTPLYNFFIKKYRTGLSDV